MARRIAAALTIIVMIGVLLLLMLEVYRHGRSISTDDAATVALAAEAT